MTFGNQCDETMSHAILDYALDAGISFIDTADIYPANGVPELVGETENIIGRWMKGRREDVVLLLSQSEKIMAGGASDEIS